MYTIAIHFAALWNDKAHNWVKGRKNIFETVTKDLKSSSKLTTNNSQVVWMHCASLGEFEQGRPVIESIRKTHPNCKIVITFFSPSGYEIQKNYSGADHVFYLPVDSAANAKKFIDLIKPTLVLWIKYEFWYHYLHELKAKQIPVLLIAGSFRKKQPFFRWYGSLWRKMLSYFTYYFLQNDHSKKLLENIKIKNVTVSGDTRFDRVIAIAENFTEVALIKEFCINNKVIVAGSTWKEDEAVLVHFVKTNPQVKFIIAPHEVDKENIRDVKKQFSGSVLYSEWLQYVKSERSKMKDEVSEPEHETLSHISHFTSHFNCLIIDSIGILSKLYNYADVTYVGGGFGSDGLHNILEAAVYGKPVIFGPQFEKNFEAQELIDCEGGISIDSALELEKNLKDLLQDEIELRQRSDAAKNYVYSRSGATEKVIKYIQEKRLLTS